MVPYAEFELGNRAVPLEFYSVSDISSLEQHFAQYSDKVYIYAIFETEEDIHYKFGWGDIVSRKDERLTGYFNKKSHTAKLSDNGFTNDLDGGLPFIPHYVYNDNVLVGYVEALELKRHVKDSDPAEMERLYGEKYLDLARLAGSLADDDNQILVLVGK